jgi:2-polyprenyl-3-methyl-5-hydroxy-6-metoxy-1,4-benzoquinol methylase
LRLELAEVGDVEQFDDPVLAYDRLSQSYAKLARRRERYLAGVEREILSRVPSASKSLLDIGAGDGSRASRITFQAGIGRIVLVEPSEKMITQTPNDVEIWRTRAEELGARPSDEKFDVITCLWNVLGHIRGTALRIVALNAIKGLLSQEGTFFMDINHRYNARSYGLVPTAVRFLYDSFAPSHENGDVVASWDVGESCISTYGHVFTHNEVVHLALTGGLEVEERVVIDYENGQVRRNPFQGNLLYVLRRQR